MREVIPWENDVLTVGQLLKYAAERYGDRPAVKFARSREVESVSYQQLYENSRAVKYYLNALCPERCNVGIVGKTDYRYLVSMNAVFMSGKALVPMSPDYDTEKLITLLRESDTEILFYDAFQTDRIEEIRAALPKIHTYINMSDEALYARAFAASDPAAPYEEDADPDDFAAIIYTSGTTGNYKGVMLSSRALISNVWFEEMSFEGENVTLNVLPMHHIFCLSCDYLKNVKDGVTICLNVDLHNIYRNLLLFEPTVLRLVPMVIESLVNKVRITAARHPEYTARQAAEKVFGRRIRNIIASGATLSPGLAHQFDDMGITIRQGYGMTETGPRISVPDGNTVCESGGRIISICKVRLQNGEIQVKSPSLMMGYYKNPEETKAVFTRDGWFCTGDIGEITPDNELFIRGRIKNLIILSNGENVSPEEIEKKYLDEPLIKEIVVFAEENSIAAEVFPDPEYVAARGIENVEEAVDSVVARVNLSGETTREISRTYIRNTPFARTASGKIIRKQGKSA
ncbi:MAG: AMP-binding protein [Clostridia bacterium]|nr:AMP-binding protein [Clostridia bacterium]